MKEKNIQSEMHIELSKQGATMFRNNVGMGWQGKSVTKGNITIIQDARPLRAGLCEGSSDLIGWTSVVITKEMVGQKIAVFTAVEVKANKRKATNEQLNFITNVKKSGGKAGVARSVDEAVLIIK